MEVLTKINWVDVLVVIIILRISYISFQEGLSHEIFPLAGAIFSVSFSLHYYNIIAGYITKNLAWVPLEIAALLSFTALTVVIGFVFKVVKVVLDKIIKVTWHPLIERFGGLLVGVVRSSVAASIVLIIIMLVPLSYLQRSVRDRSLTGMYFLRIGPAIHERTSGLMPSFKRGEIVAQADDMLKKLIADKSIAKVAKKTADRSNKDGGKDEIDRYL